MKVVKTVKEVRQIIKEWRMAGETVGLVPTMGFLHQGHGSLIKRSDRENNKTVVSVFVNPMQFSPGEDLEAYPRDFSRDIRMCKDMGADLIFNPEPEEMYGESFYTFVGMSVVTEGLCGRSRENMFGGVCTVVSKLFNIVAPDKAYFGKKDVQQLAVISQMVQDLNFNLEVIGCESIREEDGLAMSSRNSYLSVEERAVAPKIYEALKKIKNSKEKSARILSDNFVELINNEPRFKLDYVEIVDALKMQPVDNVKRDGTCIIAVAVKLGKARLIDNIEI